MKALIIALFSFVLAGCIIEINVPANGYVVTDSETYFCDEGETCQITVDDETFDEVFTAIPNEGYVFAGWEIGERRFCGGSTASCNLVTTAFGDFPILLSFLTTDDVFYLNPVFEADEDPMLGQGSANACFSTELVANGTVIEAAYTSSTSAGSVDFSYIDTISAGAEFNGNEALVAESVTTSTFQGITTVTEPKRYFDVNPSAFEVYEFGVELPVPNGPTSTTINDPFALVSLDLEVGDSYTNTYDQISRIEVAGFPIDSTQSISRTFTYLGRETITVAAGTFETCRISRTSTTTSDAGTIEGSTEEWLGVGTGMLIYQESDGTTTELISASINGNPI